MITFLVAGRNDNYGINLHKRTAISLNYLAGLCADPEDEIIYVDCNTPDHDLTLAEAIADTLTPAARQRLKTYRISGEQMRAAIGETPLPFSDELSRNVGLRRSNPKNLWLLSTNCDILIHPLGRATFHEIIEKLAPRFYLCPRMSILPPQWQMLDRMDVAQAAELCDAVIRQGARMPKEKPQPWLRFDSVGDFQLAPRDQWLQIHGCEEGMKFWGHSDANNARRLSLLNGGGRTPDLGDELAVLHLDHNPSVAVAHTNVMVHNDWRTWVEEVTSPKSRNGDNWGLADLELPLIEVGKRTGVSATQILKTHPRRRSFLAALRLKTEARFWRKASQVANRIGTKRPSS